MKFLIIAALVAVASADYHDDVFHFGGAANTGLRTSFLETSSPLLTKKYSAFTPAYTKQYSSVYSPFVAQPAYAHQYSTLKHVASPLLVKSIEHEVPVYSHIAHAQPVYSQYVKSVAEPAVYSQYVKSVAEPVYSRISAVKEISQPAVYSQYSTLKKVAQPAIFNQQYAFKQLAQPVYSQYSTLKKVSQPAVFAQYKPLVAQQYSADSLAGISTYASAYNGPQFRILSHVQEADPAGAYKVSYATENGIQATEQGSLIGTAEGAAVAAQGAYSYTGPDGVQYTVNYIADENGFRAVGDHLPTPPPVPAEIARSLELNAQSNERYDEQGRLLLKK